MKIEECTEHLAKNTPIILHQRYCNHQANRIETLLDVRGHICRTNCQEVHLDYFKDVYTLAKEPHHVTQ